MPKILFCKIAYMKYYQGINKDTPYEDIPHDGGSFVEENEDAAEQYNFLPVEAEGEEYCFGFVATKSKPHEKDEFRSLRIERIVGANTKAADEMEEDVLVVWCAKTAPKIISVVGWYDHATVYRYYQEEMINDDEYLFYNVKAKAKDCVLLPWQIRQTLKWRVPAARQDGYGFGQSLVWYAENPAAESFIKKIGKNISAYDGENDIGKNK